MKRKVLLILLSALMVLGLLPQTVLAAGTPPATISAPLYLGVADYGGSGVNCTISAPDDLRALLDMSEEARGYHISLRGQVDFKIDGGSWHYTSAWDDPAAYEKYALNYYNAINGGQWKQYLGHQGFQFPTMFPDEKNAPPSAAFDSWNWYKSHSITFRSRFAADCGGGKLVFSDWSQEFVLSNSVKMDYKKIINTYAPTLVSSRLEQDANDKRPYIWLDMSKHPAETQKLNAAADDGMWTEIWMRKESDKEFKLVGETPFCNEAFRLDVSSYYKGVNVTDFASAAYEVKVRYKVDERDYMQSGVTSMNWLYSPYSNTLSYGMPAWSAASQWAAGELKKADEYGLIPDILKGADLTKNITREEFAEVALLMYEKASGITNTTPVSTNPFADTVNPQILKAFKLGIVKGMSATEFKPKDLINREQVAAMLTRTIRIITPNADYSTAGAPIFTDQKVISGWALNDCLYMAKIGIIKGSDGKFMPRATTDAQKAVGYANTSREQALAMSVRAVEKIPDIKDSKAAESGLKTQNTQPASTQPASPQPASPQPASPQPASPQPASSQPASSQPAPTQPASAQPASFEPDELLVGFWGSNMTSLSNFDSAGNYTGAGLSGEWWKFEADGTYTYIIIFDKGGAIDKGKYCQNDGKIYLLDSAEKDFFDTKAAYESVPDKTWRYYFQTENGVDILRMTEFDSTEFQYFDYYYKSDTSKNQDINDKIAGHWEYHFNQQSILTTPMVSASIHMSLTIHEDGTFSSNMETTAPSGSGVTTMEGKYKIENDLFVIYDGKKSFSPNIYEGNPNSAYENKPVNDLKYSFSYNEKEDILVWNNWSFQRLK